MVRFAAVATVPLALAGGAGGTTDGPGAQSGPGHFIAHRLDEDRVVFVLDRMRVSRNKLREDMTSRVAPLPALRATLSRLGPLWPTDAATLKEYAHSIETDLWTRIRVGDIWVLRAGPGSDFRLRIESLAISQVHCSMRVAVIGRVVDEEAGVFTPVKSKYYLVVPGSEAESLNPQPTNLRPALLD